MEALRRIGIDRLKTVNMEANKLPLISSEIYPNLKQYMKEFLPGWYVNTQSDTAQKYIQLRSIVQQLGLDVQVEIGMDFEVDTAKGFSTKRAAKESLLVQLPNGEFIAGESPIETFIATLRKIGFEKILRKEYQYLGKSLISTFQKYPSQVKTEEGFWISIPSTTKDKYKCLHVLSLTMNLNLKVSTI